MSQTRIRCVLLEFLRANWFLPSLYEEMLFDLCMRRRKRLIDLTMDDFNIHRCAQAFISAGDSLHRYAISVHDSQDFLLAH